MRSSPEKADELDLDLPALDGDVGSAPDEEEPEAVVHLDGLDVDDDGGDAFDDATGEDAPPHAFAELGVEGAEGGWLLDAENVGTLDVGPLDVGLEPEEKILGDDEADPEAAMRVSDLVSMDEVYVSDGGEEGPLADDEELREEDLPALDADDDGDVRDDELFDRGMLAADGDLRWDDRAWARVQELPTEDNGRDDDSGLLAVPGEDPMHSARDAAWKTLDETGRIMAATFMPGGSVVAAVATADRARALLVRIQPDGEARIIAEVDPSVHAEDDGEACSVTFVRWDAARGCLFVGGNFGVEAYRPATG